MRQTWYLVYSNCWKLIVFLICISSVRYLKNRDLVDVVGPVTTDCLSQGFYFTLVYVNASSEWCVKTESTSYCVCEFKNRLKTSAKIGEKRCIQHLVWVSLCQYHDGDYEGVGSIDIILIFWTVRGWRRLYRGTVNNFQINRANISESSGHLWVQLGIVQPNRIFKKRDTCACLCILGVPQHTLRYIGTPSCRYCLSVWFSIKCKESPRPHLYYRRSKTNGLMRITVRGSPRCHFICGHTYKRSMSAVSVWNAA